MFHLLEQNYLSGESDMALLTINIIHKNVMTLIQKHIVKI